MLTNWKRLSQSLHPLKSIQKGPYLFVQALPAIFFTSEGLSRTSSKNKGKNKGVASTLLTMWVYLVHLVYLVYLVCLVCLVDSLESVGFSREFPINLKKTRSISVSY